MNFFIDFLGIITFLLIILTYIFFREILARWVDFWEKGKGLFG